MANVDSAEEDARQQILASVLGALKHLHGATPTQPDITLKRHFPKALELAGSHGVAPAYAIGLIEQIKSVESWQDLKPFAQLAITRNVSRNRDLKIAIEHAVQLLHAASIKAVILKGGAFVIEDRDGAGWRQLSDVDLLVSAEVVQQAADVLVGAGYRQTEDMAGFEEDLHHHYAPLVGPSGKAIELHVRLMDEVRFNAIETSDILARSVGVSDDRGTFFVPCPEHRMIHLIAHAQISNWGWTLRRVELKDLVDAIALAHHHTIDWHEVRLAFARIGAKKEFLGFVAAAQLLLGLNHSIAHADMAKAANWTNEAVSSFTRPQSKWRTLMRIAAHYALRFIRNPRRFKLIFRTSLSPARRAYLARVNRHRTG